MRFAHLIRIGTVGLAVAGCDWNAFDKAVANAPVDSTKPPGGYKSRDIGKVMIALKAPADKAARYLVSGAEAPSLAVVDFDANGKKTVFNAGETKVQDLLADGSSPGQSLVELADGRIVLGAPNYGIAPGQPPKGRIFYLKLSPSAAGGVEFEISKGIDPGTVARFGLAVAAARVSGGEAEDVVVLSSDKVTVILDGDQSMRLTSEGACDENLSVEKDLPQKYQFRGMVTGDLIAGGEGAEIAVGVPRNGSPGRVLIMAPKLDDNGKKTLGCPVILEAPMGPSGRNPKFGTSLHMGDFDGDGKVNDLAVGAPPDRVYLYMGPFDPMKLPEPIVVKHPDVADASFAGDFGFRVASANFGDGLALLVSAPDFALGDKKGAGQVVAFKQSGTNWTKVGLLQDFDPEEFGSFGFNLVPLKWNGSCGAGRSVLAVGASEEVFTYFRLPFGTATDVRCGP